jgi:hypothetical protein
VRLINLIGPCLLVTEEKRRALSDKTKDGLKVLLECAALQKFSS